MEAEVEASSTARRAMPPCRSSTPIPRVRIDASRLSALQKARPDNPHRQKKKLNSLSIRRGVSPHQQNGRHSDDLSQTRRMGPFGASPYSAGAGLVEYLATPVRKSIGWDLGPLSVLGSLCTLGTRVMGFGVFLVPRVHHGRASPSRIAPVADVGSFHPGPRRQARPEFAFAMFIPASPAMKSQLPAALAPAHGPSQRNYL